MRSPPSFPPPAPSPTAPDPISRRRRRRPAAQPVAPWLGRGLAAAVLLILASAAGGGEATVGSRLAALTGGPAPGTPPGVDFAAFTTPLDHNLMAPRIDGTGRAAFIALLTGPGTGDGSREGIWRETAGGLTLVVRTGQQAPGTAEGTVFFGVPSEYLPFPPLLAAGRIAFAGVLSGPGVDSGNDDGVWVETAAGPALVAREGDPAPGVPGAVFGAVRPAALDAAGRVALTSDLSGLPDTADEGIWRGPPGGLTPVLLEGQPAPGTGGGELIGRGHLGASRTFAAIAGHPASGRLAVQANLRGPGTDEHSDEALFVERPGGGFELVAREGDPAPGAGHNVTFGGGSVSWLLLGLTINAAGRVAFDCRLGGAIPTTSAMYSDRSGSLAPEVIVGDPAPGTGTVFALFGSPVLSDAGKLAFPAALPDDDNDPFTNPTGIWWDVPGSLELLLLPGDPFPGLSGATVSGARPLGLTAAGRLAFTATVDQPGVGFRSVLAAAAPDGSIGLVAATGGTVAVDGSARTVERIVPGGLGEGGGLAYRLDFTDGSSGHFVAELAGGPLFADGFESGDTGGWSAAVGNG